MKQQQQQTLARSYILFPSPPNAKQFIFELDADRLSLTPNNTVGFYCFYFFFVSINNRLIFESNPNCVLSIDK